MSKGILTKQSGKASRISLTWNRICNQSNCCKTQKKINKLFASVILVLALSEMAVVRIQVRGCFMKTRLLSRYTRPYKEALNRIAFRAWFSYYCAMYAAPKFSVRWLTGNAKRTKLAEKLKSINAVVLCL